MSVLDQLAPVGRARLLEHQVAIVTGAGQGIGLAVAEAFTAHGASVLIADVDTERAQAAAASLGDAGTRIEAMSCDVRSASDQAELYGCASRGSAK
jgi:3-oxoacyl-[acyl-carrier protein] reductase